MNLLKHLFIFFFLIIPLITSAANYYFSSGDGDDSRTPAEAKNPNTPWKTLSKLNTFFSNLQAGDSILFKRGDTFYGSINIVKSSIYFGPYGTGNKPNITGFSQVSNWTSTNCGVCESEALLNAGKTVNMASLNGNVQPLGRYPNTNEANSGYLTFTSHVNQTSISSTQLSGVPNFTGGEVVIRAQRDILDRCLITNQTATTISYNKVSPLIPQDGYGFFFQNHISTLDQFGEWFYNPLSKKFSIYLGNSNPSSYDIRVSTIDTLVQAQSKNNITIDNIQFTGANARAIYFLSGTRIKITNCDILYSGQDGIFLQGSTFCTVQNCNVKYCNSDGIVLRAQSQKMNNSILNCNISSIGLNAGMGMSSGPTYQGVEAHGGKTLIQNNTVDSTGFTGIKFFFGDSSIVKNNYVNHFCLVKNDGGGIYTWNNVRDKNNRITAITYSGNRISGNIIMNAGNSDNGTIWSEAKGVFGAHGIYCDGNSENIEVDSNSVTNAGKGIFLHDNRNMFVHGNTLYNNREAQLDVYYDDSTLQPVTGLVIKNNILYSVIPSQILLRYKTITDDVAFIGNLDSNYYGTTTQGLNLIVANWKHNGIGFSQNFDLPTWQKTYNWEFNSQLTNTFMSQYNIDSLIGTNKYPNGNYAQNIDGTLCFNKARTCISSFVTNLDGNCYRLSYSGLSTISTSTNAIINVGIVSSSKNYILNYSLKGTKNNATAGIYLRSKKTYLKVVPVNYVSYGTIRLNDQILFTPTTNDSTTQIIFSFNDRDSSIYLDNIGLYEAAVSVNDPFQFTRIETNPATISKTILLDGNYMTADNIPLSGTITVQPYSSIVLIKKQ